MVKTGIIIVLVLFLSGLFLYQIKILSQLAPTISAKASQAVVELTGGKIESIPPTTPLYDTPNDDLHTVTNIESITTSTEGLKISGEAKNGYVVTSDENGNLSWEPLPGYAYAKADANTSGYLSSEDWSKFNNSTGGISGLTIGSGLTLSGTTLTNALVTGLAGGQIIYGGKGSSETLRLESTTDGTKGYIVLNGTGGNVGIGTTAPSYSLDVAGTIRSSTGGVMYPDGSVQTSAGVSSGVTTSGGSSGYVARFFGAETIENGSIYDAGSALTLTVDSDNQVGIGTTAPSRLLHLSETSGTTGATGILIANGSGRNFSILSGGATNTFAPGSFSIYDDTAGASRLNIISSGNIGIGVTNPGTKLEVNGGGRFSNVAVGTTIDTNTLFSGVATYTETAAVGIYGANFVVNNNPGADSSAVLYGFRGHARSSSGNAFNMTGSLRGVEGQALHQGTGTLTDAYGGYFNVDNSSTGTITNGYGVYIKAFTNNGTFSNRFGLYQAGTNEKNYMAGTLGIGVTSPGTQVEINGSATSQLTLQTAAASARMRFRGSGGSYIYTGVSGTDFIVQANNGSTNLMQIQQGGNFGIGATPSNFKLQVAGSIGPSGDVTYDIGSSSLKYVNIYASSGVVNTSDQRLKTNISGLNNGLDALLKLNPVSFNWLSNPDGTKKLGLIAQEVQQILPEVVNVGNDPDHTLGIYYTDLVPVTIKAIQEQQTQLDLLNSKIIGSSSPQELNSASLDQLKDSLTASEKNILTLQNRVASVEAQLVGLQVPQSSPSAVLGSADMLLSQDTATVSALLVDGSINTMTLSVIGNASFGEIAIDSERNAINSLSKPLGLQDISQQPIEIMARKVLIETNGDVTLKEGDLIVEKGKIKANDVIRGSLILKNGSSSADIQEEWKEKPKTLLLTPNFETTVWYENLTDKGFTIKVSKSPTSDKEVSWFAVW